MDAIHVKQERERLMAEIEHLRSQLTEANAKLERVDHALAVTLSDYAWEEDEYERFSELFHFYLIPPEPRTLEQIQEDVKRAEQMLHDAIRNQKGAHDAP